MSNIVFERSTTPLNLPSDKDITVIAVPRYHEELFQIIKDNHEWLSTAGESVKAGREPVHLKKINSEEEYNKLQGIIDKLRAKRSELFIDYEYHPKPEHQKTGEYISEFLKNKSVGTHYTFRELYRITVFPYGFDYTQPVPSADDDLEKRTRLMDIINQRKEYLIVPLLIILKKGKTLDQMKILNYNSDGTFNVSRVNPHHFYRVDREEQIEGEESTAQ